MKAFIYLRISTRHQDTLEKQKRICIYYAYKHDIRIKKIYKDRAVSGSTPLEKRKGLTAALTALKKNDLLIVASRDRLARDIGLAIQIDCIIQAIGAQLISVAHESHWDDNPYELRKRRIVDINSEIFREMVRHKTKTALLNKKKKNERIGTIPFGYKLACDYRHIEPCQHEQSMLRKAHVLKKKKYTLTRIAHILTEKGYCSRLGNPLRASHISNILRYRASITDTLSRIRYGYKKSQQGQVERDEKEQALLVLIQKLRHDGMSIRAIAAYLCDHDYRNRAGNVFHHTQICRMLQNNATFIPARLCYDQDLVKEIKSLRIQGHTLRKIVEIVNTQGHTGIMGKPLHLTQIIRIVKN